MSLRLRLRSGLRQQGNVLFFVLTQPLCLSSQARLGNGLGYLLSRLRRFEHGQPLGVLAIVTLKVRVIQLASLPRGTDSDDNLTTETRRTGATSYRGFTRMNADKSRFAKRSLTLFLLCRLCSSPC